MSVGTEIERLNASKNAIAQAIRDKGVDVPGDAKIDTFAEYVAMIGVTSGIPVTFTGTDFIAATDTIANQPFAELKLYGKSWQNGTPSFDNPVTIFNSKTENGLFIQISGANLFDASTITNGYRLIEETGELEANSSYYTSSFIKVYPGLTYIGSHKNTGRTCFYDEQKNFLRYRLIDDNFFTIEPDEAYFRFSVSIWDNLGTSANEYMLNYGSKLLDWVPYVAPKNLNIQSIPQFCGIKYSNGNWIDENGAQWVGDNINFSSGKFTQKTLIVHWKDYEFEKKSTEFGDLFVSYNEFNIVDYYAPQLNTIFKDNINPWQNEGDCARVFQDSISCRISSIKSVEEFQQFVSDNDIVSICILANPIETSLSEAEISDYKRLTTFANQTVIACANTGMEAKLYCNAEKTIDRKVQEGIAAAVKLSGGNL